MTNEEITKKALMWARKQKGDVLSNKNVDCFIAGYKMASEENIGDVLEAYGKVYNELFTGLIDKLEKEIKFGEALSRPQPDEFERQISAYKALRDALKQCKEFKFNIGCFLLDGDAQCVLWSADVNKSAYIWEYKAMKGLINVEFKF